MKITDNLSKVIDPTNCKPLAKQKHHNDRYKSVIVLSSEYASTLQHSQHIRHTITIVSDSTVGYSNSEIPKNCAADATWINSKYQYNLAKFFNSNWP